MKKNTLLLYFVFGLTMLSRIFAGETNMTLSADRIARRLEKIFCAFLEKTTQRKGISLVLESKISQDGISFAPSARNEREILISLNLSKIEKGYKLEGNWFPEVPEEELMAVFAEEMPQEKIFFSCQKALHGYGIVHVACADLYAKPVLEKGDNLASQLLYGVPVILLESTPDKSFFRIQGQQDGYIAWIASQSIKQMSKKDWDAWKNLPKSYLEEECEGFFPGSTLAYIYDDCYPYFSQEKEKKKISLPWTKKESSQTPQEKILSTAKKFLQKDEWKKTTYLWGGTCIPKLDCSGFVQTVFRMNHILLPRDSDQQYQFSTPITKEQLQQGDLVFFSQHGRYPTHVGIYIGNNLYIHCSPAGEYSGIKINQLNGAKEYEKLLDRLFFAAGRILR